ncbi:MAG: hypothetical protein ACHREM_03495 [Polyangiales bacterium]
MTKTNTHHAKSTTTPTVEMSSVTTSGVTPPPTHGAPDVPPGYVAHTGRVGRRNGLRRDRCPITVSFSDIEIARFPAGSDLDDFVMVFSNKDDARRVYEVLPKRFEKYGLTLHPEKTRLVAFRRPDRASKDDDDPGSFDLLGFTHHWALSRRGKWIVKQRTANDRFARALKRVTAWCKQHLHDPIREQWRVLVQKVRGHYGYYGIAGNSEAIGRFLHEVQAVWRVWLSRRSQRGYVSWERMGQILARYPLPPARLPAGTWSKATT